MKFDELFNKTIFEELFENQKNDFESYVIKKKQSKEYYEDARILEEIKSIIEKSNLDTEIKQKISGKFEEYEKSELKEYEFWVRKYFKLGIINGIRLKDELNKSDDTFFSNNSDGFTEYIEDIRYNRIFKNEEYQKIKDEIGKYKEKYPRLITFFEDNTYIENITEEEQNAIFEVMSLIEQMFMLEEKEMFKMGMKEMRNM